MMAIQNNPVIGTVTCNVCDKEASVHQVLRGKGRRGMLYIRGCDCVCNQSTGDVFQKYWRENAKPRPGYEDLFPGTYDQNGEAIGQDELKEISAEESQPDEGSAGQGDRVLTGLSVLGGVVLFSVFAIMGVKK